MPEDNRNMTVADLKKYIANLPGELEVFVGLSDTELEPLTEIFFTNDYVALMSSENPLDDVALFGLDDADDEVIDGDVIDGNTLIDAEIISSEKPKRAA